MSWWNQLPDAPPPDVARNQRTAARAASIVANPLLGAMTLPAAPPPELMGPQQDQTDSPFAHVEAEMAARHATPQFWMDNLQNVPPPSAAPAPQQQTAPAAPESPAAGRSFISSEALAAEAARRGISQQDMLRLWTNRVSQQQQADQQAAAAPTAPVAASNNQYSPDAILRRLAIAYEVRGGGGLGGMSPQEAAATLNAMSHLGAASLQDRQSRDLVALQREQMRQANSREQNYMRFAAAPTAAGIPQEETLRQFLAMEEALRNMPREGVRTPGANPPEVQATPRRNIEERSPADIQLELSRAAFPRAAGAPQPTVPIPIESFISNIPQDIINSPRGLAEVLSFLNSQYRTTPTSPGFAEWWSATQGASGYMTTADMARTRLEGAIGRQSRPLPGYDFGFWNYAFPAQRYTAFSTRTPYIGIPGVSGQYNTPLNVAELVRQLQARGVRPQAVQR